MNGPVVVIGDVVNDLVVRALGPVEVGSDTDSEIRRSPGGSGANQAVWLASLGVAVRFYGRAGASDVDEHRGVLRDAGVDARLAADRRLPTGDIVVLVTSDGERSMFTDRGANRGLCAADLPSDLDGVALLHVSGYALFQPSSAAAVRRVIDLALDAAVPVSCDPSSSRYLRRMGPATFLSLTAGVDTIFPNAPEARLLAGHDGERGDRDVALDLTTHYPTVVVTLGPRGALLATRDGSVLHVDAPAAAVVDSTGAGDAFCAGYLAASLRASSPADAVRAGLETSAAALGHLGGRPRSSSSEGSGEPG